LDFHALAGLYPLKLIVRPSSLFRSLPFSCHKYIPFIELIKIGESDCIDLFGSFPCCFDRELVTQLVTRFDGYGNGVWWRYVFFKLLRLTGRYAPVSLYKILMFVEKG
jgi:hypothetical protein